MSLALLSDFTAFRIKAQEREIIQSFILNHLYWSKQREDDINLEISGVFQLFNSDFKMCKYVYAKELKPKIMFQREHSCIQTIRTSSPACLSGARGSRPWRRLNIKDTGPLQQSYWEQIYEVAKRWLREKYSQLNHTTLSQCQIISLCKAYRTIRVSLDPARTSFCVFFSRG